MENNKDLVHAIVERMKTVLGFKADADLSIYFGSGRSTAGGWKARGTFPIKEMIQVAVERGISLDWLILGRGGQQIDASVQPETEHAPKAALEVTLPPADVPGYVDLPVLDMGHFNLDNRGLSWKVPCLWLEQEGLTVDDTIMVRAVGDPMEPTIVDGEMVVVDRRPRDTDGVFLVRFGDTVRFKRVQRMVDGSIRLSNDNPAYAVDVVKKGDEDTIEVIGYCHASVRSVR